MQINNNRPQDDRAIRIYSLTRTPHDVARRGIQPPLGAPGDLAPTDELWQGRLSIAGGPIGIFTALRVGASVAVHLRLTRITGVCAVARGDTDGVFARAIVEHGRTAHDREDASRAVACVLRHFGAPAIITCLLPSSLPDIQIEARIEL